MDSLSIDGSILKGGGQIVRNSISLSALLGKPVSIQNIRLDRNPPGLKNQHRTGLELAAQISSAQLTGAINRSSEIEFVPGRINLPNHYRADSVTAGSIALILQVTLPLLLFSSTPLPASTLTLLGGTNATLAPQVDYTKHVFLPFIRKHSGLENCSLDIKKMGYFPKGGGEVELSVIPLSGGQKLRSFSLMNPVGGAIRRLAKAGFIAGVEDHGPVDVSPELSKERRDVPVDIKCKREPSRLTTGAGSGIVLWAELEGGGFIGGSAVGRKGQAEASIGEEAVDELLKGLDHGGCVDEWLQDQIIIFMALADGKSEVRCGTDGLSLHTRTAIWIAEELTDAKFEIENEPDGKVIIRCQGIGYEAPPASADTQLEPEPES